MIGQAIAGFVVGVIAKLVMPGKDPGGMFVTALIGMAGSVVGSFLGRSVLGRGDDYVAGWTMSILGAIVLLAVYRIATGSGKAQAPKK